MKYLHNFEHTIENYPTITKKYIVVEDKQYKERSYIIQIFSQSNELIEYKQLYFINDGHLTTSYINTNEMTKNELFRYHSLIYQSDNLKDCLNVIKTLTNINKYNL